MIDDTYQEIIEKEIDGTATPEESARLARYIEAHPEARSYYEEVTQLSAILGSVSEAEPPDRLKQETMASIRARHSVPRRREGWYETFVRIFTVRRPVPYAFSFGAGIAVGILVLSLASRTPVPESIHDRVSGMMIPDAALEDFQGVASRTIDVDGIRGTVSTKSNEDIVLAEIEISSPGEIEIVVELPKDGLRPLGHFGEGSYAIILERGAELVSPLRVKLYSGEILFDGTLPTVPPRDS
jgi:hypothetical protein